MTGERQGYELVDFGAGRKLERFAGYLLDRPSPAAEGQPRSRPSWEHVDGRFEGTGETGSWTWNREPPTPWLMRIASMTLRLKPTPFGHLGVFPEQQENWEWLQRRRPAAAPLRVLNLFAYTGASTLAAALAGAHVTHVDAAANVVKWARDNAALNQLSGAPVRWIVEDVLTFVAREAKRGRRYDAVIMDPPSFGRGPKGQQWRFRRDLNALMKLLADLTRRRPAFFLFTCHSTEMNPREAARCVRSCFGGKPAGEQRGVLHLSSDAGSIQLKAGVFARAASTTRD